jgi:hypothetical protein
MVKTTRLLFKDLAKKIFTSARVQKLQSWIENADSARASKTFDSFANQYDKAEELITFYAFAPLLLSLDRVSLTNRILGLAGISAYEENVAGVGLERQYPPPAGYLYWIRNEVKSHPLRYIREKSTDYSRANKPFASRTHVGAFIETDKLIIFFEMKYTSDISYCTTFNPCRNQLARLIDVGIEGAEYSGKEVLVLLCTPSRFYEGRSRLYYYKVQEYSDPLMISNDIAWRPVSQIRDNVLAVKWVALEQLINVFYEDFRHPDKEEAVEFFKERHLA